MLSPPILPEPPEKAGGARRLALLLFAAIALFLRSPQLFTDARFWAEEGTRYYNSMQSGLSFFESISVVVSGNFILLTNIIVYLSTLVPASRAPMVTTSLSFAVFLVLLWQVLVLLSYHRVSFRATLFCILAVVFIPQGYEVFLTSTNVQWILSASVLVICLLPLQTFSGARLSAYCVWLVICAGSGVPSVVLAPIFLLRYCLNRSPIYLAAMGVLMAGACMQMLVIFDDSLTGRELTFNLLVTVLAPALQSIWSVVIGAALTQDIVNFMRTENMIGYGAWIIPLISLTLVSLVCVAISKVQQYRELLVCICAAWLLTTAINVFGSIGSHEGLISGWAGGRYFFFGACCFTLLITFASSSESASKRLASNALMFAVLCSSILEARFAQWPDQLMHGPSWREEINACNGRRPCKVHVWPGKKWTFVLKKY